MGNGSIYDLEKIENNQRCVDVKEYIIMINLTCAPLSLILLIVCILRMIINKKKLSFFTYIVILIFVSEIMNSLSKLLQLLKYAFKDTRNDRVTNEIETQRGSICQTQIVTSIFSDYCSLISTLLLSIRALKILQGKNSFFDNKKGILISIVLTILISCVLSIIFLIVDRILTRESKSYKYDLRDRCSYWCWLDHISSLICYFLYSIILTLNIIYAYKTNSYLNKGYQQFLEQIVTFVGNSNNINDSNDNNNNSNNNPTEKINSISVENENDYSPRDRKRIGEFKVMKIKCFIYPFITIGIWGFFAVYRIADDIIMMGIDGGERTAGSEREKQIFNDYPVLKGFMEAFLVIHTFFSSIRGILYGFSFIIFEEKTFGNCFRRCIYKCFCIKNDFDEALDIDIRSSSTIRYTGSSSNFDKNGKEGKEDTDSRPSNASDYKRNINDMNTSDYNYDD